MAGQSRQGQKAAVLRNYPRKVAPGAKAIQAAAESRYLAELRQHFQEVPTSTLPLFSTSATLAGILATGFVILGLFRSTLPGTHVTRAA